MTDAIIAGAVFAAVMILIISERVHRTVAALAGAVFLIASGTVEIDAAVGYIDFNTIGVLTGMMMMVSVIKCSGIFEYVAVKASKAAGGDPWRIMAALIVVTAVLSSILDNVTTVLLMGPVTIYVAGALRTDPVPFLITQVMASNIGGTATLIGDPPNIMIGSAAGLDFMDFAANNGPVTAIVLITMVICFRVMYGKDMSRDPLYAGRIMAIDEKSLITDRKLLIKSVVVMIITVFGFVFHSLIGLESSVIALASASVMLMICGRNAEEIVMDIEWPTIMFFTGLFVVVGGIVETGMIDHTAEIIIHMTGGDRMIAAVMILWSSALLSSTLDNIPFVATMIPLITALDNGGMDTSPLWWALSLGACLGGNGTIIGASANVVMAGISEKNGHPISYMRFFRTGFPLMIVSVAICTVYLIAVWHR